MQRVRRSIRKVLAAVVLGSSLIVAGSTSAENPYRFDGSGQAQPFRFSQLTPPPAAPAPAVSDKVTSADVRDMLQRMGYEVEFRTLSNGLKSCRFVLKNPGFTHYPSLCLSEDGSTLWLNIPLLEIPGGLETAPTDTLVSLLARNVKLGPATITYQVSQKRLNYALPIPNHGVTSQVIRENIDMALKDIRDTESLWNPDRWERPAGTAMLNR